MTVYARDVSNYTSELTPEVLEGWTAAGVGLVIVQAVAPPPGYPAGKTRQQIQQCLDAGLAVDAYVWLWFDAAISDIQRKLDLLRGLPIGRVWLDVEDAAAANYDQATTEAKVHDALVLCDNVAVAGGRITGVYSGRWFWTDRRYMGNTTAFSDRDLWDADYDGVDDTGGFQPYGGWTDRAIKQYAGSQPDGTDLNVLSAAEAERLNGGDVTDPERQEYERRLSSYESALGYLGGDVADMLEAESRRKPSVRRLQLRNIANEMRRVRAEPR